MIFLGIVELLFLTAIYFIPALVAGFGHKQKREAIMVLNLLAGWTVIGWVAAAVWAVWADEEKPLEQAPAKKFK